MSKGEARYQNLWLAKFVDIGIFSNTLHSIVVYRLEYIYSTTTLLYHVVSIVRWSQLSSTFKKVQHHCCIFNKLESNQQSDWDQDKWFISMTDAFHKLGRRRSKREWIFVSHWGRFALSYVALSGGRISMKYCKYSSSGNIKEKVKREAIPITVKDTFKYSSFLSHE